MLFLGSIEKNQYVKQPCTIRSYIHEDFFSVMLFVKHIFSIIRSKQLRVVTQ